MLILVCTYSQLKSQLKILLQTSFIFIKYNIRKAEINNDKHVICNPQGFLSTGQGPLQVVHHLVRFRAIYEYPS
jgi:hypothetical protein